MKFYFFCGLFIAPFIAAFSQSEKENDTIERNHYNHWSVEMNLGQNKPIKPFADGYYASKPNTYFYFNGVEHYDIGIRYMFSNVFGLKLDFAFDDVKNQKGSGSLDFQTKQYRLGLQGVANLGRLLRFETFTHRFGLLIHGGVQISTLQPTIGLNKNLKEQDGGFIYGITPQFRLTNWLVITGDFTGLQNFRQHLNWDGTYSDHTNSLSGTIYNTSIGMSIYLGDRDKKHADWYITPHPTAIVDKKTEKRLTDIETLMNDTDKDGVPDYLDQENNTPAGITVDTRGKFIDVNKNGVPDELERKKTPRIDQKFEVEDDSNSLTNKNDRYISIAALNSLVENGNINIFFDINQDTPNSGSTNNVNMIYQYLKLNPHSNLKLTGYADKRGVEAKNKDLSNRRAGKLRDFYIKSGIAPERIEIVGEGVDNSFPATKTGLAIARRVSVTITK